MQHIYWVTLYDAMLQISPNKQIIEKREEKEKSFIKVEQLFLLLFMCCASVPVSKPRVTNLLPGTTAQHV